MDVSDWLLILGLGLFLGPPNLAVNSPIGNLNLEAKDRHKHFMKC